MSDYFDRVERQIVRRVQDGVPAASRPRLTLGHLAVAAAVLVVVVVAGVFLAVGGNTGKAPPPASHPASTLAFTASPADPRAIDQSVKILRERLHAALPGARVAPMADGVTVTLSHAAPGARSRILALAAPGRLAFYDWEANVLAPNGKPVASQLSARDPTALEISQGNGPASAGTTGAGCVTVEQALALATRLEPSAPRRTEYVGVFALPVPPGFVVLEATDATPRDPGVYLLRGAPAITNADVMNPRASTDPNTRTPLVTFAFTAAGRRAFQALTATVARRGSLVSGLGETLNQHFAIAVDNKLITVPYIDFKQYPAGINGDQGADIAGGLTTQSAKELAILLRYGPLPVQLTATG
jgi:hypothetical protein